MLNWNDLPAVQRLHQPAPKVTCLGECRREVIHVCAESGKCQACCDNECGCNFLEVADKSRYDNLCESAYLRSLPEPQ